MFYLLAQAATQASVDPTVSAHSPSTYFLIGVPLTLAALVVFFMAVDKIPESRRDATKAATRRNSKEVKQRQRRWKRRYDAALEDLKAGNSGRARQNLERAHHHAKRIGRDSPEYQQTREALGKLPPRQHPELSASPAPAQAEEAPGAASSPEVAAAVSAES